MLPVMAGRLRLVPALVAGVLLFGACAMPTAVPTPFEDLRPPEDCPPELCPHTPDPTYSARPTGTSSPGQTSEPDPTPMRTGGGGGATGSPPATRPGAPATSPLPNAQPSVVRPTHDDLTGIAVLPSIAPPQPFPLEAPPRPEPLDLPLPAAAVVVAALLLAASTGALIAVALRDPPRVRGLPA